MTRIIGDPDQSDVAQGSHVDQHTRMPALVDAAWEHGRVMPEADGALWRQDACGAWIRREQVGRQTEFGWKIVKIVMDAGQTADNVRPFHWRNDYDVAAREPRCRITADRSGTPGEEQIYPPRNRDF